ncbi:glucose-1-phosphate thymidylyltransferase [bacterium]|nr:glucose-1-phosphate thymidylyltransferase [bacterium]
MPWKDLSNYFETIPTGFLQNLFKDSEYPWSPIKKLSAGIESFFEGLGSQGNLPADRKVFRNSEGILKEGAYFIQESEILKEDFIDTELKILIKSGTLLESGATIKNHSIIESNCEIRQGAYIRGFVYIGEQSVVGHTTEIKNSIFSKHVEAGHFAYIGDTIIGSYVNLGAGTKISNLEFRTLKAKQNNHFPEINVLIDNQKIQTGLSKFGAIIGDGCEIGCNAVLCPFVLLQQKSWVMPNICVLKGIYKKGTLLRESSRK